MCIILTRIIIYIIISMVIDRIVRRKEDQMLEEFKIALLNGTGIGAVAHNRSDQLEKEVQRRKGEIEASKRRAEFIEVGLKEPKGTEPRTIAESFLKQYEHETGVQISNSHYKDQKPIAEMLNADMKE